MTIKRKIFVNFLLVVTTFILSFGLFSCVRSYSLLRYNILNSIGESIRVASDAVDYYFRDANDTASSIIVNQQVQEYLLSSDQNNITDKTDARHIAKLVSQYSSTRPYILKVYLINKDKKALDKDIDDTLISDAMKDTVGGGGVMNISQLHIARYSTGSNKAFSLISPIFGYGNRNRQIGTIVVDVDFRTIENIINSIKLPIKGNVYLVDNSTEIIAGNNDIDLKEENVKECINNPTLRRINLEGNYYYLSVIRSNTTGMEILSLVPEKSIISEIMPQLWFNIVLIILGILTVSIVTNLIINYIYMPLNLLTDSMKNVEKGNLNLKIEYERKDEFATVIDGYNSMILKLNSLMNEIVQNEEKSKKAEIYALQAQISPHFLYNTLNSIRYFARAYNAVEIMSVSTALIKLAEASLSSEVFIKLDKEIELTQQYLIIQKIRYGDIFHVSFDIDPSTEQCMIPRFSIQPLVENSIFHGLLPKGSGNIKVSSYLKGEGLFISVEDDGEGIDSVKLQEINEILRHGIFDFPDESNIRSLKNIGLENINYRIKKNYSSSQGYLEVESDVSGTSVKIYIPERIYYS
jgi:two-component system sensor histidine kinase YesM